MCYDCFNKDQRVVHKKIKDSRSRCYVNTLVDDRYKYYDDKGNWDGKSYLCKKCGSHKWYMDTIAPMRKCRTKDIDFNILKELNEKDKGRVIEDIVAEVLCLKNLNVVSDNYNSPSDSAIQW